MYYVEHDYITVNYFIDGGARFARYKGNDGLEKVFPQLREDEPVARPKRQRRKAAKSTPQELTLAPEMGPVSFEAPNPLDYSIPNEVGVDYSELMRLAQMMRQPAPMPTPGDILRMSIDEFEASSEAYLSQLMSEGDQYLGFLMSDGFSEWDKAIKPH